MCLLLRVSECPIITIGPGGLLLVVPHLFAVHPVSVLGVGFQKLITKLSYEKHFCRVPYLALFPAKFVTVQKNFKHPSLVICFFPTPPIKLKVQIGGRLGTNSNPPGSFKLSTQSTAGVRLCCAFYHSQQHPVQKCWAKTILLSQTSMFRLFVHLIFFYYRATCWAPVELLFSPHPAGAWDIFCSSSFQAQCKFGPVQIPIFLLWRFCSLADCFREEIFIRVSRFATRVGNQSHPRGEFYYKNGVHYF